MPRVNFSRSRVLATAMTPYGAVSIGGDPANQEWRGDRREHLGRVKRGRGAKDQTQVARARRERPHPGTSPATLTVAQVAESLGVTAKTARHKLRQAGLSKNGARWTVVFGSDEHRAMICAIRGG